MGTESLLRMYTLGQVPIRDYKTTLDSRYTNKTKGSLSRNLRKIRHFE